MAIVDAIHLYENITGIKLSLTRFRKSVALSLLDIENTGNDITTNDVSSIKHEQRVTKNRNR